ncbi:MAG TPA: Maf family protein [Vicinamibacterales bacterium]|nr:Maf family protein [Vicinamibacterales bacterium]
MRLVLASASPRRADLLRAAGYAFDTLAVDLDERVHPGEAPAAYVARLAREKSAAAMERLLDGGPERPAPRGQVTGWPAPAPIVGRPFQGRQLEDVAILGADTTVVVDGAILGKPEDDRDAAAMLHKLSDRAHEVLTGVSLRTSSGEWGRVESTRVYMTALSPQDVAWYVASGEGRDKAGGYAAQGLASRFISRIEGSYSNVVGLPVATVEALLREAAPAR